MIVGSQNLQGLLLPVVLVFMVLLVNDKRLMGDHRNGRIGNVLAWAAVGLVIVARRRAARRVAARRRRREVGWPARVGDRSAGSARAPSVRACSTGKPAVPPRPGRRRRPTTTSLKPAARSSDAATLAR